MQGLGYFFERTGFNWFPVAGEELTRQVSLHAQHLQTTNQRKVSYHLTIDK
jgi:hypothetical protein